MSAVATTMETDDGSGIHMYRHARALTTSHPYWSGGIVLLAIALLIVLLPETPARRLTPATGWIVRGGLGSQLELGRLDNSQTLVRKSVCSDPESQFWRSWTPQRGNEPLSVVSPRFPASSVMAVTVTGRCSGVTGPSACWLERVTTRERIPIYFGSVHTSFNDVLITPPPSWVGHEVQIYLDSNGSATCGVGHVYEVSWISALKASLLGRLPAFVMGAIIFGAVMYTGALCAVRAGRDQLAVPMALVALGLAGLTMVMASGALRQMSLAATTSVRCSGLLVACGCIVLLYGASKDMHRRATRVFAPYMIAWLIAVTALACLCGSASTNCGHWEPNYRFWPSTWSSDHELPWRFAEALLHGRDLSLVLGDPSGWRITDRPPLMTGQFLLLSDGISLLQRFNDGPHLTGSLYVSAGTLLNCLWIPVTLWLMRACFPGVSQSSGVTAVVFCALVPFTFFTTTYGWPKAFGASMALAAFGMFLIHRTDKSRYSTWVVGVAALSGLSLLAHASIAFFLAPLWLLVLRHCMPHKWRTALMGLCVMAALLSTWELYKRCTLPSNEPVTRYALTGDFGFGSSNVSLLSAVLTKYGSLSLYEWLSLKGQMLADLFVPAADPSSAYAIGEALSIPGALRASDLFVLTTGNCVVPVSVCLAVALCIARVRRPNVAILAAPCLLVGSSLAAILVYFLTCLSPMIIHHLPHAAWFGLTAGASGILAILWVRALRLLVAFQTCYFAVVWVVDPIRHAVVIDPFAILGCLTLAGTFLYRMICSEREDANRVRAELARGGA